jgi:hypothetical protein
MSTEENAALETIRSKTRCADEDETPSLRRALETTPSEASRKSMAGEQTDELRESKIEIGRTLAHVNQEDENGAGRSQPKPARETQQHLFVTCVKNDSRGAANEAKIKLGSHRR